MGMMRHPLENSPAEGEILTRHSGTNFGIPYKFVASPDTKAFSQAPPAIMDALNRLTWAGQDAVMDGSYRLTKMPYSHQHPSHSIASAATYLFQPFFAQHLHATDRL